MVKLPDISGLTVEQLRELQELALKEEERKEEEERLAQIAEKIGKMGKLPPIKELMQRLEETATRYYTVTLELTATRREEYRAWDGHAFQIKISDRGDMSKRAADLAQNQLNGLIYDSCDDALLFFPEYHRELRKLQKLQDQLEYNGTTLQDYAKYVNGKE